MVEEMRSTGWEHEHGCEADEKASVLQGLVCERLCFGS